MSEKSDRLTKLNFAAIDHLANGDVADAVNMALDRAIFDLDRVGGAGVRKVTVEVSLTQNGLKRFKARVLVKVTLPRGNPQPTCGYLEREADTPRALFSPTCAENPDQLAIPFAQPAADVAEGAGPQPTSPKKPARKKAAS